jgi:hypothetical protein
MLTNTLLVVLGLLAACVLRLIALNAGGQGDVQHLPGPASFGFSLLNPEIQRCTQSSTFSSWIWGHELLVFQHAATQMYSIWARSFGGLFKIKAALFHPDIVSSGRLVNE